VTAPTSRRAAIGLAVAIVAIAANLRPAVASVGPVLDDIQRSLHLSDAEASAVTAAPVVCFGLFAPLGAWLTRRVGMRRAVTVLTAALLVGLVLRLGPDLATFVAGTLVAAAGIAALNVVTPVLVKADFPRRTGAMMGIYTTALVGVAGLSAGVTVPAEHAIGHGWRGGLAVWAVAAAVGLVIWAPHSTDSGEPSLDLPRMGSLLRDRVAWAVTGYFGLQSLGLYALLAWLPTLFADHGYSDSKAGALLSVCVGMQAPVALITPSFATRRGDQGLLVIGSAVMTTAGFFGLLLAPTAAPWVWVVLLGIGQGSSFPLSLTMLVLRSPTPDATTALSSMAQTGGYLIAALGVFLVGVLHAAAGGWSVSVGLLLVLMVPQLVCGLVAGRPRAIAATDDAGITSGTQPRQET
jgi:MFS transporter, CP family, cyanate transporter